MTPLPASLRAAKIIDRKCAEFFQSVVAGEIAAEWNSEICAAIITRETHLDECVECLREALGLNGATANRIKSLLTKLEQ